MYKRFIKILICICFILLNVNIAVAIESLGLNDSYVYLTNMNEENVNIEIKKIDLVDEPIEIGQVYDASAVMTINIKNNSYNNIELSNLNVYVYQKNQPTKYFVSTYENEINGFIGYIESGQDKDIKIGVTLHNKNDKVKIELLNIEKDVDDAIHAINLK